MMNSPIIERVLEESGWAQKVRDRENERWERDRQIWAEKLRQVEADRQKAEADQQKAEVEKAELQEKVRLLEQSLKEQSARNHAE
jgi:hypothetical protein